MKVTAYFDAITAARTDPGRWADSTGMKIHYYEETDTLHIEFRDIPVVETRDLDANTLLDLDAAGNICAITVEHASERAGMAQFSYEQVTA